MSNKEAVKKLIALLGGYKKTIVVIIGCLLISTALNLCIPLLNRRIMDDGFIGGDKEVLLAMVLGSLLIYLISSGIDLLKEKKRVDIAAKLQYALAEESYSHLIRMEAGYFTRHNYAEIMNSIREDVGNIASIADESTFFVVTQIFGITGGMIGLLIIDWRMTLLVMLFIPVKYVVTRYFARRRKQAEVCGVVWRYHRRHQGSKAFWNSGGQTQRIRRKTGQSNLQPKGTEHADAVE